MYKEIVFLSTIFIAGCSYDIGNVRAIAVDPIPELQNNNNVVEESYDKQEIDFSALPVLIGKISAPDNVVVDATVKWEPGLNNIIMKITGKPSTFPPHRSKK